MDSDRMYACLQLPGWSAAKLGRRINTGERAVRGWLSGRAPVPDNLAAWLEAVAAVWSILTPDLREAARAMDCDRGKWVRNPASFRPVTDEEAEKLHVVAAFHAAVPVPVGWRTAGAGSDGPPDQAA